MFWQYKAFNPQRREIILSKPIIMMNMETLRRNATPNMKKWPHSVQIFKKSHRIHKKINDPNQEWRKKNPRKYHIKFSKIKF